MSVCVRMKSFSIFRVPAVAGSSVTEIMMFIVLLSHLFFNFNFLSPTTLLFSLSFYILSLIVDSYYIGNVAILICLPDILKRLGGHILCSFLSFASCFHSLLTKVSLFLLKLGVKCYFNFILVMVCWLYLISVLDC